jgi:hypothetical protein
MHPMERTVEEAGPLSGQPLFTVGRRRYGRRDVIAAAILRGEWRPFVDQARAGLACARRLSDEAEEPDSFDLELAAREFREARGLVSSEDTEAWLARHGLSFEDWSAYLERSLLRRIWAGEIGDIVSRYGVGDEELGLILHAEAVCSGELQRFAETLADRAAVGERALGAGFPAAAALDDLLVARTARECAAALGSPVPGPASAPHWTGQAVELARMEATFQACVRHAITPEAVHAQIVAHRLEWIRLRWRCVVLRDEAAAREAVLCLRHDGELLDEVAERAGVTARVEEPLVERVDAAIRAAAISARPDDLLGPWPAADGFRLALLLAKAQPAESDAEVRRRAEEEIARSLVADAAKSVVWHERP